MCAPVCVRVRSHCSTGRLHATSGGAGGGGGVKGASEPTGLSQDPGGAAREGREAHTPWRGRVLSMDIPRDKDTHPDALHIHRHTNTLRHTFHTNPYAGTYHTVTTLMSNTFTGRRRDTQKVDTFRHSTSRNTESHPDVETHT